MPRSNPLTSVDAAQKALADAQGTRDRVLAVIRVHGPLTLDAISQHYMRYRALFGWKLVSEAGIRSRAAELARAKPPKIERVPDELGRSRYGNPAHLWRAVDV